MLLLRAAPIDDDDEAPPDDVWCRLRSDGMGDILRSCSWMMPSSQLSSSWPSEWQPLFLVTGGSAAADGPFSIFCLCWNGDKRAREKKRKERKKKKTMMKKETTTRHERAVDDHRRVVEEIRIDIHIPDTHKAKKIKKKNINQQE